MSDAGWIQAARGEEKGMISLLQQLVERESPSTAKEPVDRLSAYVAGFIQEQGFPVRTEPRVSVGDLVWTETGGNGEGVILVLCHLDTVWEVGSLSQNPFRVEGDRVYGPGIYDMKAGVAATLWIQRWISQGRIVPRKRIRFLYTTDEETGSHQSRELIEQFAAQSDLVLVTEPPLPGGGLKTFRKGVGDFILHVQGRAAHAGVEPEAGINAVVELAHQILELDRLSQPEMGSTVTVTVVQGGTRENVVPQSALARIDVRFKTIQEGHRLEQAIRNLVPRVPGATLRVEGAINRPPMLRTEETCRWFDKARAIAAEIGISLEEGGTGGGSDGSFSAGLGIPTLDGLGVDGDGAHAAHEHILLSALPVRVALLARLIERL